MEATRALAVDTVAPADVERAVAVIVLAFSADPVARQCLSQAPPRGKQDGVSRAGGTRSAPGAYSPSTATWPWAGAS